MKRSVQFAAMVAVLAAAGACAKKPKDAAVPEAAPLDVAGIYATTVSLQSNSCSGITVQNNPTKVEHVPGSSSLKVIHAGRPFDGTFRKDGRFTTIPSTIIGGSETTTLAMSGKFTQTGFIATVTVDITRRQPCKYIVRWVGTKQ